jgi:hypothetical protein
MRLARSSMLGFDSSHVPESHTGHFPPATRRDEIDAQNFILKKKIWNNTSIIKNHYNIILRAYRAIFTKISFS